MAGLNDAIDCKNEIINAIAASKEIMGLIFDDPNIDMNGDLVNNVRDNYLFDHSFNGDAWTKEKTAIFVECQLSDVPTRSIKKMEVIIQIASPSSYLKLENEGFKARKGNRNDNIAVAIAGLLENENDSDVDTIIGELELGSCLAASFPSGSDALQMNFTSYNFR